MTEPTSDVVIIGGGVIGLSTAYACVRRGLRVRLLDRAATGTEASWAGAGILPPAGPLDPHSHPLEQLASLSLLRHAEWAEQLRQETGIDTGFRRCGGLQLAPTPADAAAARAWVAQCAEEGIEAEWLGPAALAELEPGLLPHARSLLGAVHTPGECQLRNPRHLRALAEACRLKGVVIDEHCEVESLELAGGRVRRVVTARGPIEAPQLVLTAGAWTRALLAPLGITIDTLPIRGQMVLFQCSTPPLRHIVNEGPRYLVPREDGRLLAGSTEEEVGFDKRTTPEALAELERFARERVGPLCDARVERSWAGLRPGSFDGFPYIGKLPQLDNAFAAAGHFRSGLYLSPATAELLAQLLLGEPPSIDVRPFRVGRR